MFVKEQYLAEVQDGYCEEGKWCNAKMMTLTDEEMKSGVSPRYCKSKEEAQQYIDRAIRKGQKRAMYGSHLGTPPFSLYSEPNEKDLITNTRIRKRQVSEWEEV